MSYKILERQVVAKDDVRDLHQNAVSEGYQLYAGIGAHGRYGYSEHKVVLLTPENSFVFDGKLFFKTPGFTEEIIAPSETESKAIDDLKQENTTFNHNELQAEIMGLETMLAQYKKESDLIFELNGRFQAALDGLKAKTGLG